MIKKILISVFSFILFILVVRYIWDLNWYVSLGFTALLLIHEIGHVIGLKRLKYKTRGMYFVPFLGAFVLHNGECKTRDEYSYIKYMGPLIGSLGVLLFFVVYLITKEFWILQSAFLGAILNLINLMPITMLDGYAILKGVHKRAEWIGITLLLILGIFILEAYVFTLFLMLIATMFSEEGGEGYGFVLYEFLLGIGYVITMIVLITKNFDINDFILLLISIYALVQYFIETKIKKQTEFIGNEKLIPLNKKQKIKWGISWLALTGALAVFAYWVFVFKL